MLLVVGHKLNPALRVELFRGAAPGRDLPRKRPQDAPRVAQVAYRRDER
jgi:hypothetical protein